MGDPVSFKPYLDDILLRLQHQYRLTFATALKNNRPAVLNMRLKVGGPAGKTYAPQQVLVVTK
jgi:hypothetical protein